MSRPSIEGLQLEPCCVKALNEIQKKITTGRRLQKAMGVGLLTTLIAGRHKIGGAAGTTFNVSSSDWGLFAQATAGVPAIVKNRCRMIASFELMDNHAGGELGKFWRAMERSF